jgi:hypothetical protein
MQVNFDSQTTISDIIIVPGSRYETSILQDPLGAPIMEANSNVHVWFQIAAHDGNANVWNICDEGILLANIAGNQQHRAHRGPFTLGSCVGTAVRITGLTEGWYGGLSIAEVEIYDRWTPTLPNVAYQLEQTQRDAAFDRLNRLCDPSEPGVVQFKAACWLNCPATPLFHEEGSKLIELWVERRAGRQGDISAEVVIDSEPLQDDNTNPPWQDAVANLDFESKFFENEHKQELAKTLGRYILTWEEGDCEPKRFFMQLYDDVVYEGSKRILLTIDTTNDHAKLLLGSANKQEIIITDNNDKYAGMVLFGSPHTLIVPEQDIR